MKMRSLALLAVATVIAVGAAAYVSTQQTSEPAAVPVGQRLFPDLPARAGDVVRIEIERGPGSITLARREGEWVAADRGDYPVQAARVRELVVDMAQLTTLEPRTSTPSLYSSMEVEDPSGAEPRSGLVRLLDANGTIVASLIVGRTRSGRTADDDTVFVRRAGEAQSWLVRGRIGLPREVTAWLDRTVAEVERPRVARVTTVQPDGARAVVERASPEATEFTLQDVPEGRRAKPAADLNQVGQAFDRLELDDVRPAGSIPFPDSPARAEVETFDGLVLTAEIAEHEGVSWVRFAARAEPLPTVRTPPAQAPTPSTPMQAIPVTPAQPAIPAPAAPATAAPEPPAVAAPPAPARDAPVAPPPVAATTTNEAPATAEAPAPESEMPPASPPTAREEQPAQAPATAGDGTPGQGPTPAPAPSAAQDGAAPPAPAPTVRSDEAPPAPAASNRTAEPPAPESEMPPAAPASAPAQLPAQVAPATAGDGTPPPAPQSPAPAPAPTVAQVPASQPAPAIVVPETPPSAPAVVSEDVVNEAAALNARLSRWVYRLPTHRVEAFKRKLEDLLEARSS